MNPAEQPYVSVIIPAYNAAATLERALNSVIAQHYDKLEIVVIDDMSDDDTVAVASNYPTKNLKILSTGQNAGAATARNVGIQSSHGEIIAFLDADDEWLDGKLKKQVEILMEIPEVSVVTCEANYVILEKNIIFRVNKGRPRAHGSGGWRKLLYSPSVATPCVVVRRSALDASGLFNQKLASGEDQDMWIRLSEYGLFHHLDEVLTNVYDRPSSLSKNQNAQVYDYFMPVIEDHIQRNAYRMSRSEIRLVLARRYYDAGRIYYSHGRYLLGLYWLAKSSLFGHSIKENFLHVAQHLAGDTWRWIRGRF